MRKTLLPVILVCLLPLAVLAQKGSVQTPGHWMGADFEDAHDSFYLWYAADLGLTEAQVDKLNKLKDGAVDQRRRVSKDLVRARAALHDLLMEEEPNQKKIDEKAELIGKLRGELIKLRSRMMVAEKKVLTKDQLKKFDELMAKSVK